MAINNFLWVVERQIDRAGVAEVVEVYTNSVMLRVDKSIEPVVRGESIDFEAKNRLFCNYIPRKII